MKSWPRLQAKQIWEENLVSGSTNTGKATAIATHLVHLQIYVCHQQTSWTSKVSALQKTLWWTKQSACIIKQCSRVKLLSTLMNRCKNAVNMSSYSALHAAMKALQNVTAVDVTIGKMANAADGRPEKVWFLCYCAILMIKCSSAEA